MRSGRITRNGHQMFGWKMRRWLPAARVIRAGIIPDDVKSTGDRLTFLIHCRLELALFGKVGFPRLFQTGDNRGDVSPRLGIQRDHSTKSLSNFQTIELNKKKKKERKHLMTSKVPHVRLPSHSATYLALTSHTLRRKGGDFARCPKGLIGHPVRFALESRFSNCIVFIGIISGALRDV